MSKEYLRNRPFLAVSLTYVPADNVNTSEKGWQTQPGSMKTMEKVSFVDRIKDSNNYALIIDIINSKVIKNRFGKSENELMATYLGNYSEQVKAALSVWAQREASKIAAEQ